MVGLGLSLQWTLISWNVYQTYLLKYPSGHCGEMSTAVLSSSLWRTRLPCGESHSVVSVISQMAFYCHLASIVPDEEPALDLIPPSLRSLVHLSASGFEFQVSLVLVTYKKHPPPLSPTHLSHLLSPSPTSSLPLPPPLSLSHLSLSSSPV